MKVFRSLCLAVVLSCGVSACAQAPKTVEYNAGMCGPSSVGAYHVVLDGKKMVLQYYFDHSENAIVKDADPITFDYVLGEKIQKDKEEYTTFDAKTDYKGHEVVVKGFIHKDRMAALLFAEGDLIYVYYGVTGSVDELAAADADILQICDLLHKSDVNDIPAFLTAFLDGGSKEQ